MSKRLKVQLFPGWKMTDGPREDYPYRFYREASQPYGVLDMASAALCNTPEPECWAA